MACEKLEALKDVVLALVKNGNVDHGKIVKEIRALLVDASKGMAAIPVVLNACFGGFNLSEHFQNYLNQLGINDTDNRVLVASHIKLYGAQMCLEFPNLHKLVSLYYNSNIQRLYQFAACISLNKSYKGHCAGDVDEWNATPRHVKDYLVDAAKAWGNDDVHTKSSDLLKHKDFMVVLSTIGFAPDVWLHQNHFQKGIMFALTCAPETVLSRLKLTANNYENDKISEIVGLLAASGCYSKLVIVEVPALVGWKVNEYDGWESIEYY